MSTESTVFLVDDDPSVRRSLSRTLHSAGYTVIAYASALDFLAAERKDYPGCLVLDVDMPGLDGMELQKHLAAMKWTLPIIFITAHRHAIKKKLALESVAEMVHVAEWLGISLG